MRKIAFLDRDGTLIVEPPKTFQVDSLDDMVFLPHVISSLKKMVECGYELVIVTNQDALGTPANPIDNFEHINRKMYEIFASEDIIFKAMLTCPHKPSDNCTCRKPKTGLIDTYLNGEAIDKARSFMVGDRDTDVQMAEKFGMRGFKLGTWDDITKQALARTAYLSRKTAETEISLTLNLDGDGRYDIKTGLEFFDHMLHQLARHGGFDINLTVNGDLKVDEHHTIEDTAIVLGQTFKKALGDKRGIERYASQRIIVMDEAKCEIAIDLSGRPYCVFDIALNREYVGDFPTEMLKHFFNTFALEAGINMHMNVTGDNSHHQIEACFKALARVLKDATRITGSGVVSTKGAL